jgi:hypothetical protein
MPAVIAMIAGVATTTAVTGMVIAGITIGAVGAAVIGAVVSGAVAGVLIDKPDIANFKATAANVLLNKKSNNAPIPVIYGIRRVGGTIVFMATRDKFVLNINLVISEGEIESYIAYYLDGKVVSTNPDLFINEYFGTETQEANSNLEKNYSYYNNTHRLNGTAYIAFQFGYKKGKYPSGIPLINVLVQGIKMFDPRTSLVEWTNNPVLCVRDYLTNSRYGRDIDPSLIDDISFILAANYCDEEVAYNGTDLIKRYTCNGVVETQNNSLDIIKQLLSSCRGILIFSGGLYKIIIDKPEMAVFTFSEDNIIGGWKIKLGSKNSQYNRIRANFFNASKEYQADIAIVDSAELREQDGGLLETMTSLPFNTDIVRARAITNINLNQSRRAITCEFTATIEALRVEVGDVVYINHKTPGWDTHNSNKGKKFRITRVTIQNNDEVRILAAEYADEVYDIDIIDDDDPLINIEIDDLSFCIPPTDLTLSFNISRFDEISIFIGWTASTDAFVVSYELRYQDIDAPHDFTYINVGDNLSFVVTVLVGARIFGFSVRAVNIIGVSSEWLT